MFQHSLNEQTNLKIKQILDTVLPLLSQSWGVCNASSAENMSEAEMVQWYAYNFPVANGLLHLFGFHHYLSLPTLDPGILAEWKQLAANGFNAPRQRKRRR
jgi:hypothetical protein